MYVSLEVFIKALGSIPPRFFSYKTTYVHIILFDEVRFILDSAEVCFFQYVTHVLC